MKFPYGICDFYDIVTSGYFYVDRTGRIPAIEDAGKHLLFLRPRRFGKSLLLSMLENYYDVAKADEFETLFGHLAVGKNPTGQCSKYFVMNWDFSAVSPQGDSEQIRIFLHNHINGCLEIFLARYRNILDYDIQLNDDALRSFQSVLAAVQASPYKLYLLIDEYDNFANEIMMGGQPDSQQRYQNVLYGEGALKTVFKAVKSATKGLGLDRAFITGVSPVVLSDITSGHNIAENISLFSVFSDLCGFRETDISDALDRVIKDCRIPEDKTKEALHMMRAFYNGYGFGYQVSEFIYNPTLVLYFLKAFQRDCQYPRRILDTNLAMDKNKINYISRLPHGEQVILNALEDTQVSIAELADRFGVEDMLSPSKDTTFMASLLYYFGVLTLTDRRTELGELILKIPNLVIRKLYAENFRETLLPDFQDKEDVREVARTFYSSGNIRPLCDFMERRYFRVLDNRDYRWANELTIKTAFLTLLFNDTFYIMDSEPALERKYADMIMIVRPDMRQYKLLDFLIEFKYVNLKKNNLSSDKVRKMSEKELSSLSLVKEKMAESEAKLKEYRLLLDKMYGDVLRLKVFSVVAVGFERIVWKEES
ncbi:MAG: AAA family ATPase [Desulfobacteraceae bacterium]|nr:AAA family ATPase [Desulfobacteraceae bacterium]